jgi:hypothetical protein
MNVRSDQLIRSAEGTLRARYRELLGAPAKAAAEESAEQGSQK